MTGDQDVINDAIIVKNIVIKLLEQRLFLGLDKLLLQILVGAYENLADEVRPLNDPIAYRLAAFGRQVKIFLQNTANVCWWSALLRPLGLKISTRMRSSVV